MELIVDNRESDCKYIDKVRLQVANDNELFKLNIIDDESKLYVACNLIAASKGLNENERNLYYLISLIAKDSCRISCKEMKDNYRNNFEDMRDNSEEAYELVNSATVKLKKLQLAIRNTKIEKLKQNFNDEFALGYNLIEKLGNVISLQPIDVERVNKYYNDLKVLVEGIEKEALEQIKKAEYTEKLIMCANSYRSQFAEVARNCAKAELYFFDARFDEAIELIKESLQRYIDLSVFEAKNKELEGVNL